MVFADILGTKDLLGIVFVGLIVLVVLFMGRRINVNVRGVTASIEAAATNAEKAAKLAALKAAEVADKVDAAHSDIKESVGEKNGNGNLATMAARALGEIAELDRKVDGLASRVEQRTHITRSGHTEPEELGPYTQDRLHDVLAAIGLVSLKVDTMWTFIKADYDLPDLPSMKEPK